MVRKLLLTTLVGAMALGSVPAFATSAGDPDDSTSKLDIRNSGVRVLDLEGGGRRVRLAVRTYGAFDLITVGGSFYWQLDTNGDTEQDFEVFMWGDPKTDGGPLYCWVKEIGVKGHFDGRIAQTADDAVQCGFPLRHLDHAPKNWRVASRLEGVVDRAPNSGWYGV
jgi:hypothetical protein